MKLTNKADYSLRVIIYLLKNNGKRRIQDIADFYSISANHLRVVVHELSQLGVIESTPGPQGGIELSTASQSLPLGELLQKVEKVELVECFDKKKNTCRINSVCKLKPMLQRATDAFFKELDGYTVADLN